jgi:hypothetical protein
MRPLRNANFVNNIPVVKVLWIFALHVISKIRDFRGHRLKAYIPVLLEARTLLYGCKRLAYLIMERPVHSSFSLLTHYYLLVGESLASYI